MVALQVLTLVAGALLEKQIVVICSNLVSFHLFRFIAVLLSITSAAVIIFWMYSRTILLLETWSGED